MAGSGRGGHGGRPAAATSGRGWRTTAAVLFSGSRWHQGSVEFVVAGTRGITTSGTAAAARALSLSHVVWKNNNKNPTNNVNVEAN